MTTKSNSSIRQTFLQLIIHSFHFLFLSFLCFALFPLTLPHSHSHPKDPSPQPVTHPTPLACHSPAHRLTHLPLCSARTFCTEEIIVNVNEVSFPFHVWFNQAFVAHFYSAACRVHHATCPRKRSSWWPTLRHTCAFMAGCPHVRHHWAVRPGTSAAGG